MNYKAFSIVLRVSDYDSLGNVAQGLDSRSMLRVQFGNEKIKLRFKPQPIIKSSSTTWETQPVCLYLEDTSSFKFKDVFLNSRKFLQFLSLFEELPFSQIKNGTRRKLNYPTKSRFLNHVFDQNSGTFNPIVVHCLIRPSSWSPEKSFEDLVVCENGFLLTEADFLWEEKLRRLRNIK